MTPLPDKIDLPPGQYTDAIPSGYTLVITAPGVYLERPNGPRSLGDLISPAGPQVVTPTINISLSWLNGLLKLALVAAVLIGMGIGVDVYLRHRGPVTPPKPSVPDWIPPNPPAPPTPTPLGSAEFGQLLDERLAKMAQPNNDLVTRLDAILNKLSEKVQPAQQTVQYQYAQPTQTTQAAQTTQYYYYPTTGQYYYYPSTGQYCYVTRGGQVQCR